MLYPLVDPVRAQRGRPARPDARSRCSHPEIRDHFNLDNGQFLLIVALGLILGLLLSVPFGFAADRVKRLPIVIGGAIALGALLDDDRARHHRC